jgi:hypothetical protein
MALTAKKVGCKVLSFLDVILDLLFVAVTVYNGVYSFQASLPSREAVAHLFDDCVRNGNNECAQHYWNYGVQQFSLIFESNRLYCSARTVFTQYNYI